MLNTHPAVGARGISPEPFLEGVNNPVSNVGELIDTSNYLMNHARPQGFEDIVRGLQAQNKAELDTDKAWGKLMYGLGPTKTAGLLKFAYEMGEGLAMQDLPPELLEGFGGAQEMSQAPLEDMTPNPVSSMGLSPSMAEALGHAMPLSFALPGMVEAISAKERPMSDRLISAAPGIGAAAGGLYSMAKTRGLNPKARLLSAIASAAGGAGIGWLPDVGRQTFRAMKGE